MRLSSRWGRVIVGVPVLLLALVLILSNGVEKSSAQAWTVDIDGKIDDAYLQYGTMTRYGDANIHSPTGLDDYAAAYLYVLEDDDYVYVFYHQDIFYANDNSYGQNSIHWESRPSGMRNFGDIWESDKGEFTFEDAEGGVAAHFYVDQISPSAGTPSGYANLGFSGGDGLWLDGYADPNDPDNFTFSSPMDFNLNSTGYCSGGVCRCGDPAVDLLVDSPAATGDYEILDSDCNQWLWYNGWEIRVKKSVFGFLGFGVVIGNHHNSPTKTCQKNKDCPTDLYIAYSSIGDRVWYDLDGDGEQDSGEPGLAGITVNLIDPRDGHTIESQVTDSQGDYLFEELSHMYYIVQVDEGTLPGPSWSSTTYLAAPPDYHISHDNYTSDPIVCPSPGCIQRDEETYENVYYIQLDHPEDYRTADFGFKPSGYAIGDYVWSDDGDGVQELGEPGIGEVELQLFKDVSGVWTSQGTTTTNASGWYLFSGLLEGDYYVQVNSSLADPGSPLFGYELTEGPDSSTNPTDVIELGPTPPEVESHLAADFGYHKDGLGSIGDYVWFDTNNDGVQDGGELGAEGVTLALYWDENGNEVIDTGELAIANTITNASGNYTFSGLELNLSYLVKVTDSDGVLDGFTITTYWGDDYPTSDPLNLSRYNEPCPIYLPTTDISPDPPQGPFDDFPNDPDWCDFGYNRPGTIGDLVWFDWNQNGSQDSGEIGVGGVTVSLSGDANQITTTAADGSYLFTELDSGDYTVGISLPAGYSLSSATPDNPHIPNPISLTGNESYLSADFGLYRADLFTVGDLVWSDYNANGIRDEVVYHDDPYEEFGIPYVTIDLYLDSDGDGVLDPTEPKLATATTSADIPADPDPLPTLDVYGGYRFYGLSDTEKYILQITDNNNMLNGHVWIGGTADTNDNSQVIPYAFTVSGADIFHADFGFDPAATSAYISAFNAYSYSGKVVVDWETSGELGTIGFYLLRQDPASGEFTQVNPDLLPGLIHEPQGGMYRYVDKGARSGVQYTYKLVEVERSGSEREYGPFTVTATPRSGSSNAPPSSGYSRTPHPRTAVQLEPTQEFETVNPAEETVAPGSYQIFMPFFSPGYLQIPPIPEAAKVIVLEDGLYHLSSDEIAGAMNLHTWEAEELIKDNRLQITHKGKQVAYLPDEGNQGIHFYGWAIQSNYTVENVYWLTDGTGLQMEVVSGTGPNPASVMDPFAESIHTEQEQYPATGLFNDPAADFWFWETFIAQDPTFGSQSFTLRSDGVTPSGSARLSVNLHSLSDTNAAYDNHAVVTVNGTQVGDFMWDGLSPFSYDLYFEQSLLNDGENTVEVTAMLETGVPYSIFYLDSFDLEYQRYYYASGGVLQAPAEDNAVITISGFSDLNIMVLDVSDPYRPKFITATTLEYGPGSSRVSFEATDPDARYLALTGDQVRSPDSIALDAPSNLSSPANSASYLVLSPGGWKGVAQTLADHRQGQGLSTMVVDLEDIYDEFNFGLASPYAVQGFLSFAYTYWAGPPQYVVLAGEGTLDYQDNLGYGDNHVPLLLVSTPYGLYPSDNAFGDAVGEDGLTEMAIGRLPASSASELETLISKILSYESSPAGGWQDQVFLLADIPDTGGDFPADSDDLAALIPAGFSTEKIYLSDKPLDQARQELIDGLNAGAAFVNYIGHAGPDRITTSGLLTLSDLGALVNGTRLPVVTTFTCYVGRFEIPGYDSIGEALVLDADGGAIAVWAPTGLSINSEAKALGESYFTDLFQNGESVLGDAVLNALQEYASKNFTFALHEIYTLFGDPALQIQLSP